MTLTRTYVTTIRQRQGLQYRQRPGPEPGCQWQSQWLSREDKAETSRRSVSSPSGQEQELTSLLISYLERLVQTYCSKRPGMHLRDVRHTVKCLLSLLSVCPKPRWVECSIATSFRLFLETVDLCDSSFRRWSIVSSAVVCDLSSQLQRVCDA